MSFAYYNIVLNFMTRLTDPNSRTNYVKLGHRPVKERLSV